MWKLVFKRGKAIFDGEVKEEFETPRRRWQVYRKCHNHIRLNEVMPPIVNKSGRKPRSYRTVMKNFSRDEFETVDKLMWESDILHRPHWAL